MRYQTNYRNDIFVSYAQVDNQIVSGSERGWVTTFVQDLRVQLTQKLGRTESLEVFIDYHLPGNVGLREEIISQVNDSALMLIILSQGYVSSEWCTLETSEFWKRCLQRPNNLFIVEIDDSLKEKFLPYQGKNRPIGYKFYKKGIESRNAIRLGYPTPNKDDFPIYFEKINDIASEMERELSLIKGATPKRTVFLAEVTDDLEDRRNDVQRFLVQQGLNVVPQEWGAHKDLNSYKLWLREKLNRSVAFVQLLSSIPGKKPFGASFPQIQFDCANENANLKIFQWRSLELKLENILDTDHARLANGSNVQAVSIETFKESIPAYLTDVDVKRQDFKDTDGFKLVYVSVDKIDRSFVEKIIDDYPNENKLQFIYPKIDETSIERYRKWQDAALTCCDVALVTYCNTEAISVIHQVKQIAKIIPFRRPPPDSVLFVGPPSDKEELPVKLTFKHIKSPVIPAQELYDYLSKL